MAFLSPNCVKALKGISIILHRLDDCKLTWDLPTLSLTIKGSWLPWRKGCQTLISPGMQSFFHQLLNWADQNDMVVNLTKTKEMVFGPPSITSNLPPISASSYQIQRANKAKLLGVHIDSNLSWHTHVEDHCLKGKSAIVFSETT